VNSVDGYRVVTHDGKTVGHVAGESELALIVECGMWPRKAWRALPKRYASIRDDENCVLMQVSRDMLAQSPKLAQGERVDDEVVISWWGAN
jgi:hypothetical protein